MLGGSIHEGAEESQAREPNRAAADSGDPMLCAELRVGRAGDSYRVSCLKVMPPLATEWFAWRVCAISCITGVTVMQEML